MAQPRYIPSAKKPKVAYSSPNYVPKSWKPSRPGDIADVGNPRVAGFGNQGPDQGYLFKLAETFVDDIHLFEGEQKSNVLSGCSWLALRRASILGRAPVSEDLEVSFKMFGYLYKNPPLSLIDFRKDLMAMIGNAEHEAKAKLFELVSEDVLVQSSDEITELQRSDWKLVFSLK